LSIKIESRKEVAIEQTFDDFNLILYLFLLSCLVRSAGRASTFAVGFNEVFTSLTLRPEKQIWIKQMRTLNLSHDWSIEGEFKPKMHPDKGAGLSSTGIGWYRKHLPCPHPQRMNNFGLNLTACI